MRNFEVDYETTLPPWHIGHEKYEAEDLDTVKRKFRSKHEAARLMKVTEVLAKLEKHEAECNLRYKRIEEKLGERALFTGKGFKFVR